MHRTDNGLEGVYISSSSRRIRSYHVRWYRDDICHLNVAPLSWWRIFSIDMHCDTYWYTMILMYRGGKGVVADNEYASDDF